MEFGFMTESKLEFKERILQLTNWLQQIKDEFMSKTKPLDCHLLQTVTYSSLLLEFSLKDFQKGPTEIWTRDLLITSQAL